MTQRGLLIVFSGPSGVGKDSVLDVLRSRRPDCCASVSATTRPPREGETHGVNYHFLSQEAFDRLIAEDAMLEYAQYAGKSYGTPRQAVEELRDQGKNVFLKIEVQGALQIREKVPDAVLVFVLPPSMRTLRERLERRGTEDADCVERRMHAARGEIRAADRYDYVIVNHSIEACAASLDAIVTAESCRTARMQPIIQEVSANA